VSKRVYGSKRIKQAKSVTPERAPSTELNSEAEPIDASSSVRAPKRRKGAEDKATSDQVVSQMDKWSRLWRIVGLVLVVGLSFAIVGEESTATHFPYRISWQRELINFLILFFFNAIILFPLLFEAWFVKVDRSGVELRALFWRSQRNWSAVSEFRNPSYLKFALLRSGRLFYLLNKRALPEYKVVEGLIEQYGRFAKKK
jgi:hypothetical protein